MRIGIFDPYLDDLGGGEKYMMTIADCLSRRHRVDVFWDNTSDLDKLVERFSLDISRINVVSNIFSTKVPTIKRLLASIRYDVIIILSDGSIPLVFSKKTFIHFQQPFPNIILSAKAKLKLKKINSFFCNSKFTKDYIDKEFKINSKIIYPPVDNKSKKQNKENIILHVGRFRVKDVTTHQDGENKAIGDYKKQTIMVKAFKEMIASGLKNWKFVLAVSVNDHEKAVFEEFKNETKGFPIEFLVNKKNDELWSIYSKAKIYWHASGFGEDLENHPEFAEHFGISTVEAMYAGVVPVVINAGGQKEIVKEKENGLLWDSMEELKTKTLSLIENKELLNSLSDGAVLSARRYSRDNFCQLVNSLVLE